MIDKLIEGKLVTLIVGSVFRLVEILVRAVHITVRGVRLLVQETVTSRIDRRVSTLGKRLVASRARVDAASIVLIESAGEYTGDPKYIAEEILRRGAPYRITWLLRDQSVGPFPREFHFVRYGTADAFRAIAAAKVVVQNGRSLQASGAWKSAAQHWVQTGPRHDPQTEVALATLGHARNDVLVDTPPETVAAVRKKVLDRLGIPDTGQRFLLYAPSPGHSGAVPLSGIDVAAVRATLAERFGGTWEILIRTSDPSRARSDIALAGLPAYCRNASFHPDAQELLVVADAVLADRSDRLGDYLLTRRPAFLFATDPGRRDAADSPLPAATSSGELLAAIAQFDQEVHDQRVAQLLSRSGSADDGAAARRIVDAIGDLMAR